MQSKVVCALIAAASLAGCATDAAKPGPVADGAVAFPAPDAAARLASYHAQAGDSLDVVVFPESTLNKSGEIDAAGNFTMPLLGAVPVGGKTSTQIADELTSRLRPAYLRNPQVTVSIKQAESRTFTIDGGISQPGMYTISGDGISLLQALSTAKGTIGGADVSKVVVFRTSGGQKIAGLFNVADIRAGRAPDPKIYPDDLIQVPVNRSSEALRNALSVVPFASILVGKL